jgi:hypothetical protein
MEIVSFITDFDNYSQLDAGTLVDSRICITRFHVSEFPCNPQNVMCDEGVSGLQTILHSPVTRVPRIMLRRAEEIFPSVTESVVSVCVCVHREEFYYCLHQSVLLGKEIKYFMMSIC